MTDCLGPANAPNATTVRPDETRVFGSDDTWMKSCSAPGAGDGTKLQDVFLNGLLAQVRRAIRGMGIAVNNADDDMLLNAIRAATSGFLPVTTVQALSPILPEITAPGAAFSIYTSTGQVQVASGQTWTWRGARAFDTAVFDTAARTFATGPNKTYHLVWYPPGILRASNAATYPNGILYLEDVADTVFYNPSALPENNPLLDGGFDRMLIARIVTDGANSPASTALVNHHRLSATIYENVNQSSPGRFTWDADGTLEVSHYFPLNWARQPLTMARSAMQQIANLTNSARPRMSQFSTRIEWTVRDRYGITFSVATNWDDRDIWSAGLGGGTLLPTTFQSTFRADAFA